MRILFLALFFIPSILEAQDAASLTSPRMMAEGRLGSAYCETIGVFQEQAEVLSLKGLRAWQDWIRAHPGTCEVFNGGEVIAAVTPAGVGGSAYMWTAFGETREIICLRSPSWEGCRYAFRSAIQVRDP